MRVATLLLLSHMLLLPHAHALAAQNPPPPMPHIATRLGVDWDPRPTNSLQRNLWLPDKAPTRFETSWNRLYATGSFANFGQSAGGSARFALSDATLDVGWPRTDGIIRSILSDGAGGWFIAGTFNRIESYSRPLLAHVLPNGLVDPAFDAQVGGSRIESLALANGVLYFAGGIGPVAGQARQALAAVDAQTGALLSWNPILGPTWGSSSRIHALAVHGNRVYAAGGFQETVQGVQRRHMMWIDAASGVISAWDPGLSADVMGVCLDGNELALAGQFEQILGASRLKLAVLDASTGNLMPFSVALSSTAYSVELSGNTVYVGGLFTSANGVTRNCAAAFDRSTGALLPWNPNLSVPQGGSLHLLDIAVAGADVVLAGRFTKVGSDTRDHAAVVDSATGVARPWHSRLVGGSPSQAYCAAVDGSDVMVGGDFLLANAVPRTGICALSLDDGGAVDWNPVVAGVKQVVPAGGTVFLGGAINDINGVSRRMVGAVDAATGATTLPFDASAVFTQNSIAVFTIAYGNGMLYAGGSFTTVGGSSALVALDALTGAATPGWAGSIGGSVYDIALSQDGTRLYVGGVFSSAGVPPQPRQNLAIFDALTGALLPTICNADGAVSCVREYSGRLFVGGDFHNVAGVVAPRLAQLNPLTGIPYDWTPLYVPGAGSAGVNSIARFGRLIYCGGGFSLINGIHSPYLGAVDAENAIMANWSPAPSLSVAAVAVARNRVFIGGAFKSMFGATMPYMAAFEVQ